MRRIKRIIANLFLMTGVICLGAYIYAHFDSDIYQYYAGERFDAERARITPPASLPAVSPGFTPAVPSVTKGSTIGRISIPRLDLQAIVSEGDDDLTLERAVGHMPGTALPGQMGNVVVAGHRDSFFRPLKDLHRHDEIIFTTLHGSYRYIVDEMEIVEPSNVRVLKATGGRTLTVVTCYPFHYVGRAPRRFIVRARQVEVLGRSTPANREHPPS